jgi:hypothetical protein
MLSLLSDTEEVSEMFLQLSPDYTMLYLTDETSVSILFPDLPYSLVLSNVKSV